MDMVHIRIFCLTNNDSKYANNEQQQSFFFFMCTISLLTIFELPDLKRNRMFILNKDPIDNTSRCVHMHLKWLTKVLQSKDRFKDNSFLQVLEYHFIMGTLVPFLILLQQIRQRATSF